MIVVVRGTRLLILQPGKVALLIYQDEKYGSLEVAIE